MNDLLRAKEAIEKEINTIHAILLGKLADIAADEGDYKLETGYRWLAANNKWPTELVEIGADGLPKTSCGYTWHSAHYSNGYINSHEFYDGTVGDFYALTHDTFETPAEALRIAAKYIGKYLSEPQGESQ